MCLGGGEGLLLGDKERRGGHVHDCRTAFAGKVATPQSTTQGCLDTATSQRATKPCFGIGQRLALLLVLFVGVAVGCFAAARASGNASGLSS